MSPLRLRVSWLLAMLVLTVGCSSSLQGPFVWASALAPEPEAQVYRIQVGDELAVKVWNNEPLSVTARVRSDGKYVVPLVGELSVAGETPEAVARLVESRLESAKLVLDPRVTVIVDESLTVSVIGKVVRAGSYALTSSRGVADALAAAGGLTEFARKDQIYVLRRGASTQRIRFRFLQLFDQSDPASRFRLRSGDVLFVD